MKTTQLIGLILASLLFSPVTKAFTTAQWIWSANDGPSNSWMAFRKTFTLASSPKLAIAQIAVDSKYWMWINGQLVVFEGGLKRGPTPEDTWYDEIDLTPHLGLGDNTISILVWHWGKDGFSHRNSGMGGLIFEADIDGSIIISDSSWRSSIHPAYGSTNGEQPNFRLPEYNIRYDARDDHIAGWTHSSFDDSTWAAPATKGLAGSAPWNQLIKRYIPQWKDFGLVDYTNANSFPDSGSEVIVVANLPYNAQITPYLRVDAPAGLTIGIQTDNYAGGGANNVRAEYVTKGGIQEFESLGWMNGHSVHYAIPSGVKILDLKYRETGFNTEFTGSFSSSDPFYDSLWEKARRTLYITMRDTFFDCPDRERAQWWGDTVNELGEVFYSLDSNAHSLIKKAIHDLAYWQRADNTFYSPVPEGNWNRELPTQMLASIGWYGFYAYYFNTGDLETIKDVYPRVRDYLALWALDDNGLVVHRNGDWDWQDWGSNQDAPVLDNAWYYLALKAAVEMAALTGNTADVQGYQSRMTSIAENFDRVFWTGTEYNSPAHGPNPDDRANALAVVAGLASSDNYPAILAVLQNQFWASPYLEKYVLESLYLMGYADQALARMKFRYSEMVNSPLTTLWERWSFGGNSTYNHAWSGGPLTLLSQYGAGVAATSPGWSTFHVLPQAGSLTRVSVTVPSTKGNIIVAINKTDTVYVLDLVSPAVTLATVGIPKASLAVSSVCVNGETIWTVGESSGSVAGISFAGEDSDYIKFTATPGTWSFFASTSQCSVRMFADGFE